ncbi:MAG TPA: D-alanyl-D-alanine carboxypeptidase/D-alanyl-D-alanine-endopeptidase [Solirubrobacteraceae bacterium]|nr:D-alanyl-D-alanine carboxypeptidase/D-alanyl-D-alanine-endopeptidase [Solirubrobacteraceae bacterium]
MRVFLATLGAICALLAGTAAVAGAQSTTPAQRTLQRALRKGFGQTGHQTSALVVDMTTGQTLFSQAPNTARLPASVEKLYTTSTALLRLGPTATFTTSILGVGSRDPDGVWNGTLYLRGGGDPTFGAVGFDQSWYGSGTGTTLRTLIGNLLRATGITAVDGRIVGDESYWDSLRGTPATGYWHNSEVEGELSALEYDRGFMNSQGTVFQIHPALYAAQQFEAGLKAFGVKVAGVPVSAGRTPAGATLLVSAQSPPVSSLIRLTNTPSDNYLAESLLKDIGARLGGAGTTAAGAAVVRAELLSKFGINPRLNDGSGLSRYDRTTPTQMVTVLEAMAKNSVFVNSLALMGESGTLKTEALGTVAVGDCRGKTGSLHDVANLAGYCEAKDGHTLAFAFLANGLGDPDFVHEVEASMTVPLVRYNG